MVLMWLDIVTRAAATRVFARSAGGSAGVHLEGSRPISGQQGDQGL